jgi:hypothetical protein
MSESNACCSDWGVPRAKSSSERCNNPCQLNPLRTFSPQLTLSTVSGLTKFLFMFAYVLSSDSFLVYTTQDIQVTLSRTMTFASPLHLA